ncbi:phage holin family protein [Glutamicibacter halophytocola]|uniref:phage holin family protein n=1 Tax=Glutamicibacter halophytocola TaxID=1933880 RepID=UPI00321A6EB6
MTEAESTQADESLKSSVKSAKAQVEGLKELVPQQLSDEIKLATTVLKGKGISLGMAAALAGAALVVVSLFVIAVVVTLVNVLAIWSAWMGRGVDRCWLLPASRGHFGLGWIRQGQEGAAA